MGDHTDAAQDTAPPIEKLPVSAKWSLIQQGAEARVFALTLFGRPAIAKERFEKNYRHPDLDKSIRKKRLAQEVRCLYRCRKAGVRTPCLLFVDESNSIIYTERIMGQSVKQFLRDSAVKNEDGSLSYPPQALQVAKNIGASIAKIHDTDMVHGDLTTSNMLLQDETNDLVMIDFGLSFSQVLVEDKAVDLYVMEKAFISTHASSEILVEAVISAYGKSSKNSKEVLARLAKVRARGRKRSMVG